jgi:hypothetical protein
MARKLVSWRPLSAIRERQVRLIRPEDAVIQKFSRTTGAVDDTVMAAPRQRFRDGQFIQLPGAIGYYVLLAMCCWR